MLSILGSRPVRSVLFAIITICFLASIFTNSSRRERIVKHLPLNALKNQGTVYNRTLGFQRVYAIGMAGRTDKRDALTLAASWSEVDIIWNDGVDFDQMPSKAIPEAFALNDNMIPTIIGSWRAHLNVLAKMVEENVQSALIMEDDSDWDYSLKPQLEQFAIGVSELQKDEPPEDRPGNPLTDSPYGSGWDTLWMGHCRAGPSNDEQKVFFIRNDTTVPPLPFRRAIWQNKHVIPELYQNDTRTVFKARSAGCTFAYAMTLQAARKVIASLSIGGDGVIFDVAMARMCRGMHITPYACYSIYPPLISSHRFAGSANRDSDIREWRKVRLHEEFTYDVVYSVIQNLPALVAGADRVESQWPNDTIALRGTGESYNSQVDTQTVLVNFEAMDVHRESGVNMPPAWEDPRLADDPDEDG